jgi:hypothetical protein
MPSSIARAVVNTKTKTRGIYGSPGEVIAVDTPSGATDVFLPLGQPVRPGWPPLLDGLLTTIFDFAGDNLFVYEPLKKHTPAIAV